MLLKARDTAASRSLADQLLSQPNPSASVYFLSAQLARMVGDLRLATDHGHKAYSLNPARSDIADFVAALQSKP
ncbi:hypothetical protein [Aliiroseovarius sediminis]|uniref:hypothetical protein n=1 Tax=Aliiroseovarius sediminis TaxID=2925839 RepID=UPI001F59CDA4|nr:hypothetical protein [Aliiroseovarius sediminis]MCI2395554.1 hypothetical protein [Aliiroseovarius sediminis]